MFIFTKKMGENKMNARGIKLGLAGIAMLAGVALADSGKFSGIYSDAKCKTYESEGTKMVFVDINKDGILDEIFITKKDSKNHYKPLAYYERFNNGFLKTKFSTQEISYSKEVEQEFKWLEQNYWIGLI